MDKLKMESVDLTEQNIEKIGMLFPSVITEAKDENGKLKKAINFNLLKQLLSPDVVEGDECYEFTWVGKKQSILDGSSPIRKTLRPCKEESKSWDTTENLYIEGDNLEVLKLLQGSYLNAIKMIYIDPPYNTGNDFVYKDSFTTTRLEYDEEAGVYDEEENRLFKNAKTNGRYHSDWCSMMYPRLQLARNLLSEDGVIFISIDDNEVDNLRKICDEVFGPSNFVAQLVWEKKKKGSFLSKAITNIKEYILVYCKHDDSFEGLIGEINDSEETYPCVNAVNKREIRVIPAGIESKYKEKDFFMPKGSEISDTTMSIVLHSNLVIKNGILAESLKIEGNWRYSQQVMKEYAEKKEIYITRDLYLRRIVNDTRFKTMKDLLPRSGDDSEVSHKDVIDIKNLNSSGWGSNEDADEELRLMFGIQKLMDYPKPLRLIVKLLASYRNMSDGILLDFFSGSATTAHAVMQLNAEDGGNRKFIMVQLPEATDEKSEAYKAGYKNICEIGKERIRRAGAKIEQEQKEKAKSDGLFANQETQPTLDTGFRVLKLDSTNMKDVFYSAGEYTQQLVLDLESNIKDDRTDLDLLYGVLLDWGVPLSLPHETRKIEGKSVHFVNQTDLVACFEANVSEALIREVAKLKPTRVVFRDSSFGSSPDKINVAEIFKAISPDTTIKVL